MMNVLTYITAFFMNFELLPVLTDYSTRKKGDEIKKSSRTDGHNFEREPPKDHFSKV
jgi:hypothetical protein